MGETSDALSHVNAIHLAPPALSGQLGDFRLIRELGRGGMGVVFEAESFIDERLVALKVLPGTTHDEKARQRFIREGRLASKLNHENTVYVFGTHDFDGTLAISMELVPGGNLDESVKENGPLSVAKAVSAARDIINALDAADRLGISHRDVKPSNCFVAVDGSIKLGDFGLSRLNQEGGDGRITSTGVVLASPAFASPEQLLGEPTDRRSDMYAVGATMYYLLTGALPYSGKEQLNVLAAVMQGVSVPVKQYRSDVPDALAQLIARCMARDAEQRFASYDELRTALARSVPATGQPAGLSRRTICFVVDVFLMFLPFVIAARVQQGSSGFPGLEVLALIWALMFPGVSHGFFDATPGMRVTRIQVVRRDGSRVGGRRGTLRFFAVLAGCVFVISGAQSLASALPIVQALPPLFAWTPLVPLAVCLRLTRGLAAPHDLLFSTIVVRTDSPSLPTSSSPTSATASDARGGGTRSLGPFDLHGLAFTRPDGTGVYHAVDRLMRRSVLVHCVADDTPRVPDSRRSISRVTRARWIAGRRMPGESWDAYAVHAGVRLVDRATAVEWSVCGSWLRLLASDLEAGESEAREWSPDVHDVWVDEGGNALWLDFASPGSAPPSHTQASGIGSLMLEVARRATSGSAGSSGHFPNSPTSPRIRRMADELLTVTDGRQTARIVLDGTRASWGVTHRKRLLILMITLASALVVPVATATIREPMRRTTVKDALARVAGKRDLPPWKSDSASSLEDNTFSLILAAAYPLEMDAVAIAYRAPDAEERKALGIYLSTQHRRSLSDSFTRDSVYCCTVRWSGIDSLLAANATVSAADSAAAARFVAENVRGNRYPVWAVTWALNFSVAVFFTFVCSLVSVVLVRRGVAMRTLGLEIVTATSHPATRRLLFVRLLTNWSIAILAFGLLATAGVNLVLAVIAIGAATVISCLLLPASRGFGDRAAGVYVVPE